MLNHQRETGTIAEFGLGETTKLSKDLTSELTYRKPNVYCLGALEQVQADYQGRYAEGPSSSYFYNG